MLPASNDAFGEYSNKGTAVSSGVDGYNNKALYENKTTITKEIKGSYGPKAGSIEVLVNDRKEEERYEEHNVEDKYDAILRERFERYEDIVFAENVTIPHTGSPSGLATYSKKVDDQNPFQSGDEDAFFSDDKSDQITPPLQATNYDTTASSGGVLDFDANLSDAQLADLINRPNDPLIAGDSFDQFFDTLGEAEQRAYNAQVFGSNYDKAVAGGSNAAPEAGSFLDGLQNSLDVGGLAPGIGIFADGANVIISVGRGDFVSAGFNLLAAIPGIGQGTKSAQIAVKIAKAADKTDDAMDAVKVALKAAEAAKNAKKSGGTFQAGRKIADGVEDVVPKGAVIGRLDDLNDIRPGEYTLLGRLQGNLGSPKANWQRNSSVLRDEIRKGVPIRDASARLADSHILDNGVAVRNTFLGAERNTLRNKGWTFDGEFWNPPTP